MGGRLDSETGLYNYGARYYDPSLSIWTGVDPLADQAPGWTPYRYGFNNPVRMIDPDGRFETEAEAQRFQEEQGITGSIRQDNGVYYIDGNGDYDGRQFSYGSNAEGFEGFPLSPSVRQAADRESYDLGGVNIEFLGEASLSVDLGMIYKNDRGRQGISLSGPTIRALDFTAKAGQKSELYYAGKNGEFKGKLASFQLESGKADAKAGVNWNTAAGTGSQYSLYSGFGVPYSEVKFNSNNLLIGGQEDWGKSYGYMGVLGGAIKANVRGQIKISW